MSEKTFGPDDSWFYRPTMDVGDDYPRWVEVRDDHVLFDERSQRRIVPAFPAFYETHDGKMLVLVTNKDDEDLACREETEKTEEDER